MASKRLMLDDEEDFESLEELSEDLSQENLENMEPPRSAKRYKSTSGAQTPLHRMLKRQMGSSTGPSSVLSPITELSQNMRVTSLNTSISGTPKSSTLRTFNSVSSYDSGNSLDDEYSTMFDVESEEEPLPLPENLDRLICGQLKIEQNHEKPNGNVCLVESRRSARRCLSLLQDKGVVTKPQLVPQGKTPLKRFASMNDADILTALDDEQPELIGDLSKPCALPLQLTGLRHQDLKTISCETLARLINGEFDEKIGKHIYEIIDCRYPYEFTGGHIRGALNYYTKAQIKEAFPSTSIESLDAEPQRRIYIFHCEFSSERGPKLLRFLRSNDRHFHSHNYPALNYPEIYLLHNGYKEFYSLFSELCEPNSYVPMLSPGHSEQFRFFRAKTKSWQCGESADDIGGADSGIGGSNTLRKSRSRLLYAE